MRTLTARCGREKTQRRAFTLIELLVSVTIIAILIAILVPTLGAARRNVQERRVRVEITNMEAAIAEFKALHGIDPPSRITLYKLGTGDPSWTAHGAMNTPTDQERLRSRTLIQQIWPQFDFSVGLDLGPRQFVTLTGAECLVFFLGGVHDAGGSLRGFSKDPANPFQAGGARELAVFEFDSTRLRDLDGDGFFEYLSPLSGQTAPYVYASSYGGTGYLPAPTGLGYSDLTVGTGDGPADIYREPGPDQVPHKATSFQIIFPGMDNTYGAGGVYDPANPYSLGAADHDNITNFQTSRLVP